MEFERKNMIWHIVNKYFSGSRIPSGAFMMVSSYYALLRAFAAFHKHLVRYNKNQADVLRREAAKKGFSWCGLHGFLDGKYVEGRTRLVHFIFESRGDEVGSPSWNRDPVTRTSCVATACAKCLEEWEDREPRMFTRVKRDGDGFVFTEGHNRGSQVEVESVLTSPGLRDLEFSTRFGVAPTAIFEINNLVPGIQVGQVWLPIPDWFPFSDDEDL